MTGFYYHRFDLLFTCFMTGFCYHCFDLYHGTLTARTLLLYSVTIPVGVGNLCKIYMAWRLITCNTSIRAFAVLCFVCVFCDRTTVRGVSVCSCVNYAVQYIPQIQLLYIVYIYESLCVYVVYGPVFVW